ncbi:uncharacterized protein LODBEIA_P18930 [Lodderomyces beijingensis]|uniref:Uncharacterized protein n=1 Tax=Lodderomyces beijingensis TaxID=1775926 RepID=A0ABP0ZIH7_9ASCO
MVTGQTDCQWKLSATQPVVVIDESKSLSAFLDSCPSPQLMEPMKVDEEPKEIRGTFVEELRLPERDVDPGSALIKSNSECVPFSPMPEMNMILSIKDIRERISQLALVKASRQLTLLNQPINSEDDSFYEDDERVLRKQGDEEAEDDYDDDDDDDEKPEKNCGRGGGFGDGDGCIHQTFELARIREELASLKPRSFSLSIRDFRFQPAKLSLGWLQLSGWESIDNGTRRTVKFLLICRKIKHGIAAWTRKIAAKFSSDKSEKKGKKSKKQKKAENNGSGGAAASAGAFFPKKERSSATLRPRKSTTSRRRRKRRDSMSRRKRQAAMYDRKGCLRRRRTWVNDFRPARPKSKSKKRQSSDEFLKAHRTYLTHELLRFQNIA